MYIYILVNKRVTMTKWFNFLLFFVFIWHSIYMVRVCMGMGVRAWVFLFNSFPFFLRSSSMSYIKYLNIQRTTANQTPRTIELLFFFQLNFRSESYTMTFIQSPYILILHMRFFFTSVWIGWFFLHAVFRMLFFCLSLNSRSVNGFLWSHLILNTRILSSGW